MVFTVKEVCAELKIAPNTVYKLIYKGKIKAFKISNRYRINEEELAKFKEDASNESMPNLSV